MKTAKRMLALFLAAALMLAVLPAAFADEEPAATYTLTIAGKDGAALEVGRKFVVYQIFTGDISEKDGGGKILTNIKYGSSWKDSNYAGTLVANEKDLNWTDTNVYDKEDDFITNHAGTAYKEFTVTSAELTNGKYVISNVPAGYYMVVEKTEESAMPEGKTYSRYVIQMTDNVDMKLKDDTAKSEKKVQDVNDSVAGSLTSWQDSADYDIGDAVPFKLTATVGGDYDYYKEVYALTFHDVIGTANWKPLDVPTSVVVKVDGTVISDTYYTLETECDDDCDFEVVFNNLKSIVNSDGTPLVHKGSNITVEYFSVLNSNAKIGYEGNPNKSKITFSNNPYSDTSVGNTPWDTVIVFTYKAIVTKVKDNPTYDPDVEESNENPKYVSLTGAEFELQKWSSTENKFVTLSGAVKLEMAEDKFTFTAKGLDDGYYQLVETKAPDGFNKIDPITFTITAEHDVTSDGPQLTKLEVKDNADFKVEHTKVGEVDKPTGTITTSVVNKAGNTLPSTGGMGTTIFYIFGTILVLGAGILLIAKKRVAR